MVLRELEVDAATAATIELNGTKGVLIIPASNGSNEVKQDIFDIKISLLNDTGSRNISMRIGSSDEAPTVFVGSLTNYGCSSCATAYNLQARWVELPKK